MPSVGESKIPVSPKGVGGQGLLKRRPDVSIEDFKAYYTRHHARVAMPWCLANGVIRYVQIHRPLRWANPEAEEKFTAQGINLEDWDAVAEMYFAPVITIDDYYRPKVGKSYHVNVILPDEKRFLLDEALKHLQGLPEGSVTGEVVELIIDGVPALDFEEWKSVYDEIESGGVGHEACRKDGGVSTGT